jgi:hypothetical protein
MEQNFAFFVLSFSMKIVLKFQACLPSEILLYEALQSCFPAELDYSGGATQIITLMIRSANLFP